MHIHIHTHTDKPGEREIKMPEHGEFASNCVWLSSSDEVKWNGSQKHNYGENVKRSFMWIASNWLSFNHQRRCSWIIWRFIIIYHSIQLYRYSFDDFGFSKLNSFSHDAYSNRAIKLNLLWWIVANVHHCAQQHPYIKHFIWFIFRAFIHFLFRIHFLKYAEIVEI